jgi:GAF domain-containing protein
MFNVETKEFKNKTEFYKHLNKQLTYLIQDEPDTLANLANSASLIGMLIPDINWAGYYIYKNNELVLGPFWGKPACTHIAIGEGVCGAAAETLKVQLVKNVHEFPGHIACDSASMSEIVLPILRDGDLVAVLDIDSPQLARFDQEDEKGLLETVRVLSKHISWTL